MISGSFAVLVGLLILTIGFLLGVAYMIWDRSRSSGNEPRWQTVGCNLGPKTPKMAYIHETLVLKDLNRRVVLKVDGIEPDDIHLVEVATDDFGIHALKTILDANIPK